MGVYPDNGFVATIDSTAGEVRSIATPGPGGAYVDVDDLPPSDDEFIAICIDDLAEDNPLHRKYLAFWLADGASAAGIVSAWD